MAARYAGLTTVRQPMRELGATAARLLDELITGTRTHAPPRAPANRARDPHQHHHPRRNPDETPPHDHAQPRRIATAVALATAASLVLTSCGRDENAGAGGEDQSEAIDEGKATGTIDVWAMGTEGEMLQDFSAAFEEANPDATVKVTAIPWEAAHDKIASAIASGETPDVSLIGTTWMGEFAEAGGLMPTPEGLVDEADFFPGAWGSTEVGGTSYGVPWYVETRVLYYRTDLAEKAGWSEAPQTWDDLKTFAEDLQSKGGAEYGLSLQPGQTGSWQTMMPFAWSNGATLTNEDGTEYTIDSPEMAEALDYYTSYFEEGLSQTRLLDPGELESGFAKGTYRLLHLRPVAHRPGRGRGRHGRPVRRRAAARPGRRARHVVRRRRRPRRLQGLRQRRQRLEVRAVAERARDPAGVLRRGRRPAGRAGGLGDRRARRGPAAAGVRRAAREHRRPRRPSRPGSRSPASIDAIIEQASQGRPVRRGRRQADADRGVVDRHRSLT